MTMVHSERGTHSDDDNGAMVNVAPISGSRASTT